MHGHQILVVSTDAVWARALETDLRQAGRTASVQPDPGAAGTDLQNPELGAVVIDLQLPGLDRSAVAQALLPPEANGPPEPLEVVERRHILSALLYTGGNKRRAAQLLGIARSTLIQKVRRYALSLPGKNSTD